MGFGYDPIFVANNMNETFAEISLDEKEGQHGVRKEPLSW